MKTDEVLPNTNGAYYFYCPGCKVQHQVQTKDGISDCHAFNGDKDSPTFTGAMSRVTDGRYCKFFITKGEITFHSSSTHKLAGKTVTLPEL